MKPSFRCWNCSKAYVIKNLNRLRQPLMKMRWPWLTFYPYVQLLNKQDWKQENLEKVVYWTLEAKVTVPRQKTLPSPALFVSKTHGTLCFYVNSRKLDSVSEEILITYQELMFSLTHLEMLKYVWHWMSTVGVGKSRLIKQAEKRHIFPLVIGYSNLKECCLCFKTC